MNHRHFVFVLGAALAACSGVNGTSDAGSAAAVPGACQPVESAATTEFQRDGARTLQARVEHAPLFAAVSGSGIASCTAAMPVDGPMRLDYRFRDGNTLQVTVDPRIELMMQSAVFLRPPVQPPLALLAAAERASYGQSGCGIEWQRPETRPSLRLPAATEQVYRGDVCNCQGIVERDGAGRVTALGLKSSC